eukprot:9466304-Pyramimonas_sp.AAC.1
MRGAALPPRRGCQAALRGQAVFVLDVFKRYGVASADVAPVEELPPDAEGAVWGLGTVFTCRLADLRDAAYELKVTVVNQRVRLRRDTSAISSPTKTRSVNMAR